MELQTFKKLPLGGIDRRAIAGALSKDGLRIATELLVAQRRTLRPAGTAIGADAAVIILGGSNGITRALAMQLLFGEHARLFAVHHDSDKLQIGPYHVQAIKGAAQADGLCARFWNEDATRTQPVEQLMRALEAAGVRVVHIINGIAAGATKRYLEHGATKVRDLDVAFDPVLQVPDFSRPENFRSLGLVDVEVATEADIDRTNRFMGSSTLFWVEPLARAGFIVKNESVVAFCDYDFSPDDPVYGMGPLAGAKQLHRRTLVDIRERFGARTARLCFPPVATAALGTIPGGLLLYALCAQVLKERGQFREALELAADSMAIFQPGWTGGDIFLDGAYKAALAEIQQRREQLTTQDLPEAFRLLWG